MIYILDVVFETNLLIMPLVFSNTYLLRKDKKTNKMVIFSLQLHIYLNIKVYFSKSFFFLSSEWVETNFASP